MLMKVEQRLGMTRYRVSIHRYDDRSIVRDNRYGGRRNAPDMNWFCSNIVRGVGQSMSLTGPKGVRIARVGLFGRLIPAHIIS